MYIGARVFRELTTILNFCLVSSHGPKAQVIFTNPTSSVVVLFVIVRRSFVVNFSHFDTSSETAGPISTKLGIYMHDP